MPQGPSRAGETSGCQSPCWERDHTYSPGTLVCCQLSSGTTNSTAADDSPVSHFVSSLPPNPACPTAAGTQSTSLPPEPGTHGMQGMGAPRGTPMGWGAAGQGKADGAATTPVTSQGAY